MSQSRTEGNLRTASTTFTPPATYTTPDPQTASGAGTYQHLVHDDPEAPPVAQLVVAVLHEDLWSDVVRGPHRGERLEETREAVCFVTVKTQRTGIKTVRSPSQELLVTSCLRFLFQVSAFLLEFMFWKAARTETVQSSTSD